MKITKNKFVWLTIEDWQAKKIFNAGIFELFVLHDDDSESLIDTYTNLDYAIDNNSVIGIEVGFIKEL